MLWIFLLIYCDKHINLLYKIPTVLTTFVSFVLPDVEMNDPETFAMLDSSQMTSVIAKDLKYFTKQGGKYSCISYVSINLINNTKRLIIVLKMSEVNQRNVILFFCVL